jgi:hypothetical protein
MVIRGYITALKANQTHSLIATHQHRSVCIIGGLEQTIIHFVPESQGINVHSTSTFGGESSDLKRKFTRIPLSECPAYAFLQELEICCTFVCVCVAE